MDGGGLVRLWTFSRMKMKRVSFDLRFVIEVLIHVGTKRSSQMEVESPDSELIRVKSPETVGSRSLVSRAQSSVLQRHTLLFENALTGVSVLDPETEVTGYRILFLNVNNVPQRSGIVEKIAWSDGWVRPESDKTPSRFRGWQRIDKEPMWVPSKSCSHTVRGAKLQWLIRWDGTY